MDKDYFSGIELMGSKDLQKYLNVSRSYIQRIINDKTLPAQKTSAGWIFPKGAVEEFQRKRLEKAKKDDRIHL